jgi:hypothetical protein
VQWLEESGDLGFVDISGFAEFFNLFWNLCIIPQPCPHLIIREDTKKVLKQISYLHKRKI